MSLISLSCDTTGKNLKIKDFQTFSQLDETLTFKNDGEAPLRVFFRRAHPFAFANEGFVLPENDKFLLKASVENHFSFEFKPVETDPGIRPRARLAIVTVLQPDDEPTTIPEEGVFASVLEGSAHFAKVPVVLKTSQKELLVEPVTTIVSRGQDICFENTSGVELEIKFQKANLFMQNIWDFTLEVGEDISLNLVSELGFDFEVMAIDQIGFQGAKGTIVLDG